VKRLHAVMVLVTAGIFAVSGCATTPDPITGTDIRKQYVKKMMIRATCSMLGSSRLARGGHRIDLRHFSVQLPDDGTRWCVRRSDRGKLILNTHPLMGRLMAKPERRMAVNMLELTAMEIDHGGAQFESTMALQNFVKPWIDRGTQSITVKRSKVTPDPRQQAHCVRYEYQLEERDNPLAPNTTRIEHAYGLVCQHPQIPSNFVMMALSEQYQEGNQIDAGLFLQLKRYAAKPFFDSLEFTGTDDITRSTGEDVVLKFRGFSIQQPTDDRWQLHSDNQKPHIATFSFVPLSPTHSFNATVQIRGVPANFATKQEFKEFVDTKLREHAPRFEELSFTSTLTELNDEWAVTYELRYLDKNPVNSSTPLFMTIKGFMYVHPYWKKSVLDAFYSERGTEAELDGTLDPVGQELIDGTSPEKS
jgi:hypothetical protein